MSPIDNNWRIELKPNARFHHLYFLLLFTWKRFIKSHTFAFRAVEAQKEQTKNCINSKIIAQKRFPIAEHPQRVST